MARYKLGDIAPIQQGIVPAAGEYWLLNLDMVESNTGRIIEYVFASQNKIGASTIAFDESNVLYSKLRPYLNKVVLPTKPGYATSEMLPLHPDTRIITPKFLVYFLRSKPFVSYISEKTSGAKMPRANIADLKAVEIDCPTLDKQNSITESFDKIVSIIDLLKEELETFDQLIKARFVEMFGDCKTNPKGWKTVALGEISEVGSSKRVFVEELKDKGIPFYRGTEVGALAEGKPIQPELFITDDHYKELIEATGKPEVGDLLMPSICPDGRIWVVDTEEPFYFKDGRVLWVHAIKHNFNPVFLLYTLKDRIMTDYGSIASGTTFAELKIFSLKGCQVFDAPLEEQNRFAKFISQVNKSKMFIQANLEQLETLKQSLMQKYFA